MLERFVDTIMVGFREKPGSIIGPTESSSPERRSAADS
jgi:hypothetical protein